MTLPRIIDTHAHLFFPDLAQRMDEVISNAKASGLARIINIVLGRTIAELKSQVDAASRLDIVTNIVGIHPNEVSEISPNLINEFEAILDNKCVAGIGEIGLDFHYPGFDARIQEDIFRTLIRIAKSRKLPVVIHQRDAFDRTVKILEEENVPGTIPFVFHCFGGTVEESDRIISMGGLISLTGIITFKKALNLRETVAKIPLEKLMVETDSPYLAPEPKRGKPNEPANVVYVAKKLAEIKGIPLEEAARVTTLNAKNFFSLEGKI